MTQTEEQLLYCMSPLCRREIRLQETAAYFRQDMRILHYACVLNDAGVSNGHFILLEDHERRRLLRRGRIHPDALEERLAYFMYQPGQARYATFKQRI